MSEMKEVVQQEKKYQKLKESYATAMSEFLELPQSQAKKKDRKDALNKLQAAGTAFFNAFEQLFIFGSLYGAANNKDWYVYKTETALNLLQTIAIHYAAVSARADELGLAREQFQPSLTAFGTIQRLVRDNHPETVGEWKAKFAELNLPVRGFSYPPGQAPQSKTDLLLVTVNDIETQAVLKGFEDATGSKAASEPIEGRLYRNLGTLNGTRVWHAISEMGTNAPGAMQQTVQMACQALRPSCVIAIGVGFGIDEKSQNIGDILVSAQLSLYELQRKGKVKIVPRGDRSHASPALINYFKGTKTTWTGAEVRVGLVLTGVNSVN